MTTAGKSLEVLCPCDFHAIRSAALSMRAFLQQEGVPTDHIDAWELVLVEAGNNAVAYLPDSTSPHPPVRIAIEAHPAFVEIRVHDHTRGFDLPPTFELPPPDAEGGRGLFLMNSLTDSFDYLRGRQGNCLILRRNLPQRPPPPPSTTSSSPTTPETAAAAAAELETTLQTMTEELAASYESLSGIFRFTEDLARNGVNPAFVERWMLELRSIIGADWFVLRLADSQQASLVTYRTLPPGLDLSPLPLSPADTSPPTVEAGAAADRQDVWFDRRRPITQTDPLRQVGPELSGFCHPMSVSGELVGTLTVGFHGESRTFTAGQVSITQTLADFLAIQFRDAQFEQARIESRLLQRDFEVASRIQRRLLPKEHPAVGPWVTTGFFESAQRVGGDFYDVLTIGPNRLLLAMADVMGKGLPAALFATVFRTLLHARRDLAAQPGAFLEWLNRELTRDLAELEMFITAQLAYVDLDSRTLRIAGAGHPPLLVAGTGQPATEYPSSGPPLGILPELTYPESALTLPPAATVLLYTDGMTEITDPEGRLSGIPPLQRVLDDAVASHLDAAEIQRRLAALQGAIAGDAHAADDRTFLLLVEQPTP